MEAFSQYIFLTNPYSQYQQDVHSFMKQRHLEVHAKDHYRKQLMQFAMDQKYIDSPLSKSAYQRIQRIKKVLEPSRIDRVIVAPLKKSLQTCYQLFRQIIEQEKQTGHKKLHIYIEPSISDRLNSSHAIGYFSPSDKNLFDLYTSFIINAEAHLKDDEWIFEILPKRLKQILNNEPLESGKQYFQRLKDSGQCELQSKEEFINRLQAAKEKLKEYSLMSSPGTYSKHRLLVIGSSQTLNILGATGFHQNGDPVNSLKMKCGQIQWASIVKQGDKSYKNLDFGQDSIPMCGGATTSKSRF